MFREIGEVWGTEVGGAGCPWSSPPQIEAPGSPFLQPQVQHPCSGPMHAPCLSLTQLSCFCLKNSSGDTQIFADINKSRLALCVRAAARLIPKLIPSSAFLCTSPPALAPATATLMHAFWQATSSA